MQFERHWLFYLNVRIILVSFQDCGSISCDKLSEKADVINYVTFRWTTVALYGLQRTNMRQNCRSALRREVTVLKSHLGRYIVEYMAGNHVLRLCSRIAIKLNF